MSRTVSLIQRVEIATPCPARWDDMVGDTKSRFCSHCSLNVYNLSEMTESEAERLIIEKERKLCARIYRRRDGAVMTRDCPVGLAAMRRRAALIGFKAVAMIAILAGLAFYAVVGGRKRGVAPADSLYVPSAYWHARSSVQEWLNKPSYSTIDGQVTVDDLLQVVSGGATFR
jgi:hypothetical protein